jgi:LysR family transcriptional regulator, glycine cleavage system transcriptional activator
VLPLAAPALLHRLPALRVPADLAHAPLLRTPLEPWAPWFKAAGLDWTEPTSGPKLVDLGMTLEAAVCGQGVVLGRPSLARTWLAAGSLVPLFNISAQPLHRYFLLPLPGATMPLEEDAAQRFAQWLINTCAEVDKQAQHLLAALFSDPSGTFVQPSA